MRIEDTQYLDYSDVLIRPKWADYVSRKDAVIEREFKMLHGAREYACVPIMAANMDHTGTEDMLVALAREHMPTAMHKHHSLHDMRRIGEVFPEIYYYGWWSIGIGEQGLEYLKAYHRHISESMDSPNICIDVANGYTNQFADFVSHTRDKFPESRIIAGNVATPELTQRLLNAGADIVKIGIGPGSVCITRTETGVGIPQLTAVMECADAAHGVGGLICADGGCTTPGDVAKAFGAGADFVMLGGMFAGHDECAGSLIYPDGSEYDSREEHRASEARKVELMRGIFHPSVELGDAVGGLHNWLAELTEPEHMKFYGMASKTAQETHNGGVPEYGTAEGKEVLVPYKGPVKQTIQRILGGLRSSMSYVGARKLKDMSKCTTFVRVNNQVNGVFK